MAKFAYKAIDQEGSESFGIVEAESETDAVTEIGRMGLFLTEVRAAHKGDEFRLKWREQKELRRAEEEKRLERVRSRHPRQRLVVRYANGQTDYGTCYTLNPKESSFHLDRVDVHGASTGETVQIRFSELKAVFIVKSFDGKSTKVDYRPAFIEKGEEVAVEFKDGEVIRGFTPRNYDPDQPRFYLIPHDERGNNICILVERAAITAIYTVEEYKAKREQEKQARKQAPDGTTLTQEESLGDFYFEMKNYSAALDSYETAAKKYPLSGRLRRKILASKFNTGVQHIKRREYQTALTIMEEVLKADPGNSHVKKKVYQLRRIIEREKQGKSGGEPVQA